MAKAKPKNAAEKLYLIDGSGFIFRAFFGLPRMTRRDGMPTSAVNGYCSMLLKLIDQAHADGAFDYMAVIFDTARKTFRNDIYPDYKANRDALPEELVPQFELVREATRAFNLPAIQLEGYEADDLIATYARAAVERGIEVVVVSSDKDLMQLVRPGVTMFDPMKGVVIGAAEVTEKFGVAPDKVVDVQALAGDSTDNVPGVPGIGVKIAAQLIEEYGDLDTLLARAGEIKQHKRRENLIEHAELARISRELATLKDDVDMEEGVDDFALADPDPATVIEFLQRMEFARLIERVGKRLVEKEKLDVTELAAMVQEEEIDDSVNDLPYELVQDEKALVAWIEAAYAVGVVAFDTETTSLNAMQAELVGFSLSTEAGTGCYVPVSHVKAAPAELDLDGSGANNANGEIKQIPLAKALKPLKELLEDPSVLKIAHNAKYDLLVLARACEQYLPKLSPLAPAALDDTMLLSYVLVAGRNRHNLDDLALHHLGHETVKFSDVAGSGKNQISFAEVGLDAALNYAAEDADITLRLHRALKPRLAVDHLTTVYETIERPLVPVIVAMERAGIKVDAKALTALSKDFGKRAVKLEEAAYKLAGEEFNIGSPKQLGEILFDKLGIEGGKKGKTGAYSTSADILEDLAAQGYELPRTVLDWRQLAKLKSTYTDALVIEINRETGRIHTSYGMAIASTGRLSSNEPNLQNIPVRTEEGRKIRAAFVAEAGHKLVSLDYSQIELRVLAHVAGISALIEAFEVGQDIHALTASQVFDVPLDELGPDLRRRAKAINFGIIYGISAFGLARNLGIARGDAQAYIDAYFERYPGIRDYMNETIAFAAETGYVETLFGRRIYLSGICDKNQAVRGAAERQAINAPIQGAAADIIKRAMVRMPPALTRKKLAAQMLLQVHDELLFEVPDAEVDATIAVARKVMEGAAAPAVSLAVPLVADAGVGDNWDKAH